MNLPPPQDNLRNILRCLLLVGGDATVADLARELLVTEEAISRDIAILKQESLVQSSGGTANCRLDFNPSSLDAIKRRLEQLDLIAIAERAAATPIDVVGRLSWIEEASEMIATARRSYFGDKL